jgi:hypothetical protein
MKTIDILAEGYGNAVGAAASALGHAAVGAGLYFGGKKTPDETPVKPTPLENPRATPEKKSTAKKSDTDQNEIKKDLAPTSDDKSVHGKLFHDRLTSIAKDLGVSRSNLLRIMEFESSMDPAARNKKSGARGLIQFMPKTSLSTWGQSADSIAALSAYDQLLYVWDFYRRNKLPKGANLGDMYLVTYMPAALGQPDDFVLAKKGAYKKKVWDVDMGENWDQNDQFAKEAERHGRNFFTVGDVKNIIQSTH